MKDRRLPEGRADDGSIVVSWLVKIALVLCIVSVVAFDAISVGAAHLNATDDANNAATSAALAWSNTHNVSYALNAAEDSVTTPNEEIVPNTFAIDRDGSVQLKLRRKATTLVMYRIGPLKKYTFITVTGEAPPPTS